MSDIKGWQDAFKCLISIKMDTYDNAGSMREHTKGPKSLWELQLFKRSDFCLILY